MGGPSDQTRTAETVQESADDYWFAFRKGELVPIPRRFIDGCSSNENILDSLGYSVSQETGSQFGCFGTVIYSTRGDRPNSWIVLCQDPCQYCYIVADGWLDFLGLLRWLAPIISIGYMEMILEKMGVELG